MMEQATKIQAKDNPKVALRVTKGHFSSDRFHINYYIDMSSLKMRQSEAEAVAKAMVKKYVNRVGLSKSFGISDEVLQYSKAFATKKTIDTIIRRTSLLRICDSSCAMTASSSWSFNLSMIPRERLTV